MRFLASMLVILLVSCRKSDGPKTENPIEKKLEKGLVFPLCSDAFDYSKKDTSGYFIYPPDFRKSEFGPKSARGVCGYLDGNVGVSCVEIKAQDDEHTEPIVKLYSIVGTELADSLIVHESISWEGIYEKRFCISEDKSISITEKRVSPDLENIDEQGNAPIDSAYAESTYRLDKNGKFRKIKSSGSID